REWRGYGGDRWPPGGRGAAAARRARAARSPPRSPLRLPRRHRGEQGIELGPLLGVQVAPRPADALPGRHSVRLRVEPDQIALPAVGELEALASALTRVAAGHLVGDRDPLRALGDDGSLDDGRPAAGEHLPQSALGGHRRLIDADEAARVTDQVLHPGRALATDDPEAAVAPLVPHGRHERPAVLL